MTLEADAAPLRLCGECSHPFASHSVDLEDCGEMVLLGSVQTIDGRHVRDVHRPCDCRGWRGPVAVHPGQEELLGGESGGA